MQPGLQVFDTITVLNPINTRWSDESVTTCQKRYKLLVWDPVNSLWKNWDAFKKILELDVDYVHTELDFDKDTGDFSCSFAKSDVLAVENRFTANGEVAFKFRINVVTIGSQVEVGATNYDNLVHTEFKVVYIPPATVTSCA